MNLPQVNALTLALLRAHPELAGRESVMAAMQRRLGNTGQAELAGALVEIGHITRGRLDKIMEKNRMGKLTTPVRGS